MILIFISIALLAILVATYFCFRRLRFLTWVVREIKWNLQINDNSTLLSRLYNSQVWINRTRNHPNPLCRYGLKVFSQNDEDGITMEILRRLDANAGCYLEFGVGNGKENNTLILGALGWRGHWFGNEELVIDTENTERLGYTKTWVTRENILELCGQTGFKTSDIDVISLDLDGNDLYFCQELLEGGYKPALFIVEYNASFPPPIKFCVDYDAEFSWTNDTHQGASLASFNDLFAGHGYTLICCNAWNGVNAFFVRSEFIKHFDDVPTDIRQIYVPSNLLPAAPLHPMSLRSIATLLR